MGYISQLLSSNSPSSNSSVRTITLQGGTTGNADANQISSRSSKDKIQRVGRNSLETIYVKDPLAFTAVNKQVQMIMSADYEIKCKSKKYVKKYQKFFDNIGKIGEDLTLEELFNYIFKFQLIYGNAYVEIVYNKTGDKVVDLALIDPKKIDFARDNDGKVIIRSDGKPLGYVITTPIGKSAEKTDEIPEKYKRSIDMDSGDIFIEAGKVAHFKLYTYGDRHDGIGIIEPAYKSILYRMNIEEARTNFIYQRANSPIVASVGDETHEPTPDDIDNVLENLSNLKTDRYLANPYWVEIDSVDVSTAGDTTEALNHLTENETASLGMPKAFVTGSGEATNRATLARQQKFLEDTVMGYIRKTLATFKKEILDVVQEENGIKEEAEIKWGDVGTENLNEKSKRIVNYVDKEILSPEEVRTYVKNTENIDGD
ncbi:MAG: phage portal protein family protein [archaeon]